MDAEPQYLADRTLLRTLHRTHPRWSRRDLADATHRSVGWVKKWLHRLHTADPADAQVLHARSCVRLHPPPRLDPRVVDRILEIRDTPPDHLQRTPGPKAILYYLGRDADLVATGVRLPRSTRTVWQILRQHGRIALPGERRPQPVDRPAPMTTWQLDFKDVSTVPAVPDGKQQHVVEVLNTVDVGTSILVNAQAREDFTAETTLQAVVDTLRAHGLPESITVDRDPRFVGGAHSCDFPAPLVRRLHCLGIQVTICPPQRPDKNGFVERYNRTYDQECLRVFAPHDVEAVRHLTDGFRQHYNYERPNQAVSCGNQPPCVAFPQVPARPALPAVVDPDRWLAVLDGQRYVRKIRSNGTVTVDNVGYYVDHAWRGKYVSLRLDATQRAFVVEYRAQVLKQLPIKGLVGERLPVEVYLEQIAREAQRQLLAGRPLGQQLRLPLAAAG
jgi:hypothetical protein